MIGEILNHSGIPGFKFDGATPGTVISEALTIVYYIATFLAFFWLVWGAFQYMAASGEKEKLHQARNRITWAIVGLLIIFAAFLVAQFVQGALNPTGGSPILPGKTP